MLQQNRLRNRDSVQQYNGDTYQDSSLMQQHRTQHRMAQSNYISAETTSAQRMFENGHENTPTAEDNQYQSKRVDNIGNDDSSLDDGSGSSKRSSPGFETFVMTGDMIIRTSTPEGSKKTSIQKKRKPTSQGQHQVGADGDSNKHKVKEKNDATSGAPKKKVSKIPQSKIPKSGTPARDKTKEKTKSPVSRIPKMASSTSGGGGSRENSPKSSPKNSPKKVQSKLPQLQGSSLRSPVLSSRQQQSLSSAKQGSNATATEASQRKPFSPPQAQRQNQESVNNNSMAWENGATNENSQSKQLELMDIDTNGSSSSTSKRSVPHTPSLAADLGFNSFSVVPQASPLAYPELDIPPDDITSEDIAFQNIDAFVNLEDLPPPPDDMLCDANSGDKSAGVSDADQVVPEVGGFLPIYSPSDITGQNRFKLDIDVLQTKQEATPIDVTTSPVTSEEPVSDTPVFPPSEEPLEPCVPSEEVAQDTQVAVDIPSSEVQIEPEVLAAVTEVNVGHSAPSQDLYEENCISILEEGPGNELEPEIDEKPSDVHEVVCMSESESTVSKPSSSRIPVAKSANASNSVSGVRNSKSHENYLESSNVDPTMQCVDIDFGDDIAASVDVLHYQEQSAALCAERQSKSLDNSPERGNDKHCEKILMPTFINIEEPRSIGKLKEGGRLKDMAEIRQSVGEPKVGYQFAKSPRDKDAEVYGANYNSDVLTLESIGESSTDPEESVPLLKQEPILDKCDDGIWLSIGALRDALSANSSPQHCGDTKSDTPKQQHQAEINYSGASKDLEDDKSGQTSHSHSATSRTSQPDHATSGDSYESHAQETELHQASLDNSAIPVEQPEPNDSHDKTGEDYSTEERLLGGAGAESGTFSL